MGSFKIKLEPSEHILVVTAISFEMQEVNILTNNVNVVMKHWQGVLGQVSVTVAPKKKAIPLVQPITIFPNPVANCSKLNIRWQSKITGDQTVEIYNEAGNLLQQQLIKVERKTNEQTLDLKPLPAGTYLLRITDSKTHKSQSQQFIVQ